MMRLHSGSATEPSGLRRVAEERDAHDALGMSLGRRADDPTTMPARFCPGGRSTGTSRPGVVEIVLDERRLGRR